MVDTLRTDTQTTEEEHFKLMLVMTEMERVKYLARSYVRVRLWKVNPFPRSFGLLCRAEELIRLG
jgi:GINS complex subunit 4